MVSIKRKYYDVASSSQLRMIVNDKHELKDIGGTRSEKQTNEEF